VVGGSTTDTDGLTQFAVLWEEGTVTRLPPMHAGLNNLARFLHDNGDIAGAVRLPGRVGGFDTRAAVWRDGQVDLQLGTLADGTPAESFASSVANGVNASGVVVGMSVNAASAYVPFVYRSGEMVQLDDLMPAPWVATYVGSGAINDVGQIVVSAIDGSGTSHALLLTPIPPTSVDVRRADTGYALSTHGRRITFFIPRTERIALSLFDVAGRRVATPTEGPRAPGEHTVTWDGRTRGGDRAPSGVYLVRLESAGPVATGKLTLVR